MHDAGQKKTRDRIDWVMTQHLGDMDPDDAWFPMFRTWRDRTALKIAAGIPTTGRDNTRPVLHYTLAWHKDDNPSAEHMQRVVLESLKVLGLGEHQALIAAHTDKEHLHVHVVVNTVHPETGKTAKLTFSKLEFSRWAEAYERAHGIHCEERIRNNAERARIKAERARPSRNRDASDMLMGRKGEPTRLLTAGAEHGRARRKPYVPVKHKATHRKAWFEKKAITDRMKALRVSLDAELKAAREVTWKRHTRQRDALDAATDTEIDAARTRVSEAYKPQWRNLYRYQRKEMRQVETLSGNLLDRAAYVYQNRERFGTAGRPLSLREMTPLIRSPARLQKRVVSVHERERRELAREAKLETKALTDRIWAQHRMRFDLLRDRQAGERKAERDAQTERRRSVSFAMAKAALVREREERTLAIPRPFKVPDRPASLPQRFRDAAAPPENASEIIAEQQSTAANINAPPALSRAEQIKRDMQAWRARNQGRDLGREL